MPIFGYLNKVAEQCPAEQRGQNRRLPMNAKEADRRPLAFWAPQRGNAGQELINSHAPKLRMSSVFASSGARAYMAWTPYDPQCPKRCHVEQEAPDDSSGLRTQAAQQAMTLKDPRIKVMRPLRPLRGPCASEVTDPATVFARFGFGVSRFKLPSPSLSLSLSSSSPSLWWEPSPSPFSFLMDRIAPKVSCCCSSVPKSSSNNASSRKQVVSSSSPVSTPIPTKKVSASSCTWACWLYIGGIFGWTQQSVTPRRDPPALGEAKTKPTNRANQQTLFKKTKADAITIKLRNRRTQGPTRGRSDACRMGVGTEHGNGENRKSLLEPKKSIQANKAILQNGCHLPRVPSGVAQLVPNIGLSPKLDKTTTPKQ